MNLDVSSHAANGVNVKTENQCDNKNLIESIEPNTNIGYGDLSNKILDAQTMIKDAIKLSQQIILYNDGKVGENIIYYCYHQNYGAIQSFFFPILRYKVITLNPLCILFGISSLLLF